MIDFPHSEWLGFRGTVNGSQHTLKANKVSEGLDFNPSDTSFVFLPGLVLVFSFPEIYFSSDVSIQNIRRYLTR